VGAVVFDANGRLLVVRRRHAPAAGQWSLPGGRVEPGESQAAAVEREVLEETGLRVRVGEAVGSVKIPAAGDDVYDVTDFRATVVGDTTAPMAGDDATEVAWVSRPDFEALDTSSGLAQTLREWHVWADLT
jgi:8-oxo-dGTP pyrophosphatase MutT (NUDIX family)